MDDKGNIFFPFLFCTHSVLMLRPGVGQTKWPLCLGSLLTFALLPSLLHSYLPRDNSLQSETVRYKRGVCQQFCLPSHTVDPSEWPEEEVSGLWTRRQAAGRRGRGSFLTWTQRGLGPRPDYGQQCPGSLEARRPRCPSAL